MIRGKHELRRLQQTPRMPPPAERILDTGGGGGAIPQAYKTIGDVDDDEIEAKRVNSDGTVTGTAQTLSVLPE